ncbi:MAG: carboxypeptidase-like regulatory domain-containing protein [Thermoplasmata archaeon]|nr:carboxypeptidase-like regulatory domain-containing protein [Thermoplasmata archaeon]
MNNRAGFRTLLCAAVVVISVLFIPPFPAAAQPNLDLVVEDSTTVQINSDYVLTGNIHIKDNGVLIISYSNFRILQSYDHQYSVTVEGNGRLLMLYTSFSSNAGLNLVVKGNASVLMESTGLTYSGNLSLLSQNLNSQILNSTISNLNATFGGAGLTMKNTLIQKGRTIFDADTVLVEKGAISEAMVTHGFIKMYDTRISQFTVTGEGKAEIYRTLNVEVRDRIEQEIPDANVDAYRNVEGNTSTLVAHGRTDSSGRCSLTLLTETYDASLYDGSHFFGNYLVEATLGTLNASTSFSFEPYELSSGEGKAITITLDDIVMGDSIASPSAGDLHLVGNQTLRIENNSEMGFKLDGNLFLENNATLHITNSSVTLSSRMISLRHNATLVIENSSINSTAMLYLQDKATVEIRNSPVYIKAVVGLRGNLMLAGGNLSGNLHTRNTHILVQNSEILGETVEVVTTENVNISFENTLLNARNTTFAPAKAENFNLVNVSAEVIEFHSNETLRVYNLTYGRIYTDAPLEVYYFLVVHTTNGNNRSVANSTVRVYWYDGASLKEVANGTTGVDGKITFRLLGRRITGSSEVFTGNYRLSAVYNDLALNLSVALTSSKPVVAHFIHPIVPPFEIQIQTNLPSSGHINETITVSGTVLYNHGPEVVVNGSVRITIVETGNIWNTTTDANGKFEIQINLPLKLGNYTVKIECSEKEYGLSNETTVSIKVVPYTSTQSMWEQPTVVYGTSTLVVVLILGSIILVVRYINRKRIYSPIPRRNESELVRWAVETMHRSKEK